MQTLSIKILIVHCNALSLLSDIMWNESKKQEICEDSTTLSIGWKSSIISCSVPEYTLLSRKILDMSPSTASPDVLYILFYDYMYVLHCDDIYTVNTTTSCITKVTRNFHFSRGISGILCHKKFLYIAEQGGTVYKCAIVDTSAKMESVQQ